MRPGFGLLLVCLGAGASNAQSRGSIGLGAQTVRFPGGTAFSSAVISPVAELNTRTSALSLNGTVASLPQGVFVAQGRGDWWIETALHPSDPRVALEGILAGTTATDGTWSSAAYGVGELLWPGSRWGVALGAGPAAWWIAAQPSVVALHLRARGWWTAAPLSVSWGVEPTRFLGAWFTDLSTTLTVSRGPFTGTVWTSTRISPVYGSSAAASALLQFFVSPFVSLESGGGSFLRDPYQGFPRGGYVTFSVRLHKDARPRPVSAPRPSALTLAVASEVVRFRLPGAKSVALAGDWNDWRPRPLGALGNDEWQGALSLPAGLYHFDLVVDGEWVVPTGVATVSDGFGGLVGLLVVQ